MVRSTSPKAHTKYYAIKDPDLDAMLCSKNWQYYKVATSKKDKAIFLCQKTENLPKIHKTPISSRPIVPNHSWLTCNASRWLSDQLNELVGKFTWIVENQVQVILNLDKEEALRLPR